MAKRAAAKAKIEGTTAMAEESAAAVVTAPEAKAVVSPVVNARAVVT